MILYKDTYVTVAEADEYFSTRFGADFWAELETDKKEQLLVTATKRIDTLPFIGRKADMGQPLQFPRIICGQDMLPQQVKNAVCEEAFALYEKDFNMKGVQSLRLGDASVTFDSGCSEFNTIANVLSGLVKTGFDIDNPKFYEVY